MRFVDVMGDMDLVPFFPRLCSGRCTGCKVVLVITVALIQLTHSIETAGYNGDPAEFGASRPESKPRAMLPPLSHALTYSALRFGEPVTPTTPYTCSIPHHSSLSSCTSLSSQVLQTLPVASNQSIIYWIQRQELPDQVCCISAS
jgi:hypothetical protein